MQMKMKTMASFRIDPKTHEGIFTFSLDELYYVSSLIPHRYGSNKGDLAAEEFDDAIDQLEKLKEDQADDDSA